MRRVRVRGSDQRREEGRAVKRNSCGGDGADVKDDVEVAA